MMTDLESGPDNLPWSQNGYLLFNAVRTGNLLQRLYQWNPGINCHPLFLGTRFKGLLDVSPVVVPVEDRYDPVLKGFLENASNIWGLMLFTDADLQTVVDHFRWLVSVDEPTGKTTLLNLSDPPVANALFELYPRHTDNALFGPVEHLYAVDRFEERWRHHQRIGAPRTHDHKTLYCMNEAQIEALDEVSFRNVVINIERHMRSCFPTFQAQLDARQRFAYFLDMAQGAYERGFHSESDLLHFANVMQFLHSQPAGTHPQIIDLLYQSSPLTPSQRAQKANLLALQRARQLQGAQP